MINKFIPKDIKLFNLCPYYNKKLVKKIMENTLSQCNFNQNETFTPIIYYGDEDFDDNAIAIKKYLDSSLPHYNMNIWFKTHPKNKIIQDTDKYIDCYIDENKFKKIFIYVSCSKQYFDCLYYNALLTRIWIKKNEVNVLMEEGNFLQSYIHKINKPHGFLIPSN
jgi:hypothetical protein